MTWSISHGGSRLSHGYSHIAELANKLEKAAPKEWPTLAPIFRRRSGDPFKVNSNSAAAIGAALHQAANRLHFWDRAFIHTARQIADSALLASRLGEPWRWS